MAFISNGTTILDNGTFDVSLGGLEFISEATASSSASIEFTSGIDSTYDIYKFEFINIHPQNDQGLFSFNLSTNSGSSYGITKTSTVFNSYHAENDSYSGLDYQGGYDQAQSTNDQMMCLGGNNNDDCYQGSLYIFNPSSSVYVKHFISEVTLTYRVGSPGAFTYFVAGYANIQTPINAIKFLMSGTGNIDAGTIKMYGIKGS